MNVLVATCRLQESIQMSFLYIFTAIHRKYTESNSIVVKLLPDSFNPVDSLLSAHSGLKVYFLCGYDMLL